MAVAPVSDERYYDTIYQERYMGLPAAERRRLSPRLADHLRARTCAATCCSSTAPATTTCTSRTREALINALVAANKPFTMMDYPNRTHCICEGEGTTVHLFNLLTRYLGEHLKARE